MSLSLPRRRGLMFVLSSPSGAGKTTLSRRVLAAETSASAPAIVMSVSVTTRPQRPGEQDGVDYTFVNQAQFDAMAKAGELLEHAVVFGNCYGTPAAYVEEALAKGVDVLFDIDWQGTQQLKQTRAHDVVSVFILPPSMAELERRLRVRAQDPEEVVQKRMAKAATEISHWEEYDYVLINDDLEQTLARIHGILSAERLKRSRQIYLKEFVEGL